MNKILDFFIVAAFLVALFPRTTSAESVSNPSNTLVMSNENQALWDNIIFILGGCIIVILLIMIFTLARSQNKLKRSTHEIQIFNELRQAFINADDSLIYLKDENLKYLFANRAFEDFYQKKEEEVIGLDDFALRDDEFSRKTRETDLAVLEREALLVDEEHWEGRVYKTIKFPVKMMNGSYGVGAYKRDITEEREGIKKLQRVLYRHKILSEVFAFNFQSEQEQLDYVLHQSLLLTESQYGYIYLYNEEDREFTLNSWTNGVMEDCAVSEKQTKYLLDKTGIWGEVVRQRKPIIMNNFEHDNPLKKGYPKGHVQLERFMSIPVLIDGKIVAVVGLANNPTGYDDKDVVEMTLLMSGVWNALKRKEMQANLYVERNKYLQTLISIGDGVMVVDKNGNIEMLNIIAQKLTGWSQNEALGRHYKDVLVLSSELVGSPINDPIASVFETDIKQELGNHAILTSKDGSNYCLEDSAAPIKDDAGLTQGVVLVFRDVTDKKEQTRRIEYLSFHDSLTGLYNRRFLEEELERLDTDRNIPISIIVGDVNSLKLTNDVFGHAFGDILLKKVAQVMKKSCRTDDIIARWGGDEFVILLPKTGEDEAKTILERIKIEFGKEKVKSVQGSISMGYDIKKDSTEDIKQVIGRAEGKMYTAKTLENQLVQSRAVNFFIAMLHENGSGEKEHSLFVSEMCQKLGKELCLDEIEIRKLKDAGYLHDIGKIVLDSKFLNRNYEPTFQEQDEIKKHSPVGYRILSLFENTMDLADCVMAHHEHWDGSGYPKGLKENEIPLLARIISVVESYDRMINKVDGSLALAKDKAIQDLKSKSGTQYDPTVISAFLQMIEKEDGFQTREQVTQERKF